MSLLFMKFAQVVDSANQEHRAELEKSLEKLGFTALDGIPENFSHRALLWNLNSASVKREWSRSGPQGQELLLEIRHSWTSTDGDFGERTISGTSYRVGIRCPQLDLPRFTVYKKTFLSGLAGNQIEGESRLALPEALARVVLVYTNEEQPTRSVLSGPGLLKALEETQSLSMRADGSTLCFWFEAGSQLTGRSLERCLIRYPAIAAELPRRQGS